MIFRLGNSWAWEVHSGLVGEEDEEEEALSLILKIGSESLFSLWCGWKGNQFEFPASSLWFKLSTTNFFPLMPIPTKQKFKFRAKNFCLSFVAHGRTFHIKWI